MAHYLHQWLQRLVVASGAWILPVIVAGPVHGQALRGPDLGVWFTQQRGANGGHALIVTDLIGDGVFAVAGLREGDRIVSINGRSIDSERQFVESMLSLGGGNHAINLVIARNDQQQTLALKASTLMQGMVAA